MNKTYSEALDYILEKAAEKKRWGYHSGITTEEMKLDDQPVYRKTTLETTNIKGLVDLDLEEKYGLTKQEINDMYQKLFDEGYLVVIKHHIADDFIKITLKGLDWISPEMGGFTKERQNAIDKIIYESRYDARMEKHARYLTVGTWVLGVITLLLVLVEIGKAYLDVLKFLYE